MRVRHYRSKRHKKTPYDSHDHSNNEQYQDTERGSDDSQQGGHTLSPPQGRCWDDEEFRGLGGQPEDGTRIDLGSVWLPVVNEMQIQFQADASEELPLAVIVMIEDSTVKIMAHAAPRTGGLWAQMRAQTAEQLREHGGSAYEEPGPFGPQLIAVLPPDSGPQSGQPARFMGLEGPRWMLNVVVAGPAATDVSHAEIVHTLLQHCVVKRGDQAMPRGAVLPLTIPAQITEADTADSLASAQESNPPDSPYRSGDFNPFAIGPRISEVR